MVSTKQPSNHQATTESGHILTISQVDKLGDQLRRLGPSDESLLERLQAFRAEFDGSLTQAQRRIAEALGLEATTARIKTINTIVEKLVRSKTRLSKMQDIAGVRVVMECGLEEQNAAIDRLLVAFPGAKVDDLRDRPRQGYRAAHLIATIDGYRVEIQVRTGLQDLWAQAMEKLADVVGRGIRYGAPPTLERMGEVKTSEILDMAQQMSVTAAVFENVSLDLHRFERLLQAAQQKHRDSRQRRRIKTKKLQIERLRATLADGIARAKTVLTEFIALMQK